MYPYNFLRGCQPNFRNTNKPMNTDEDRSLLLPLLFGAAVGFPLGFIASNTKTQGYPQYQQPYYPQPIVYQQPYYPQQIPYQQPNYYSYY